MHFSKANSGFDSAVKGDKQLLGIFLTTALAILIIACINFTNLFISTPFIRAKTIGIKKSQGATKTSLILDFYKETIMYVRVFVAFVFACPIAYYAMNRWLEGFAYKIELSWWVFAATGLIVLLLSLLSVSWQSLKAARANPVDSLKSE